MKCLKCPFSIDKFKVDLLSTETLKEHDTGEGKQRQASYY